MAYGVKSTNDFVLHGISNTKNSSQLDMIMFSDAISSQGYTSTVSNQGAAFYLANANGGTISNNSTASFTAFGISACSGAVNILTGTTSNTTGYSSIATHASILPGIPTPSSGLVTKYEAECLIRTGATIFDTATNPGRVRFGFMNVMTNAAVADGVYFERLAENDTPTTDTNWQIIFVKDTVAERKATGMSFAANKTYRLYLCVEKNSSGTFTTTYKIKNMTDSTSEESTMAPSVAATYYPAAAGDYMGVGITVSKAGSLLSANSLGVHVDYLAARIRRPVSREILIGA